jgi:hypothetical protein
VRIRGNHFAEVGNFNVSGPNAIDLGGRTVIPGLIESTSSSPDEGVRVPDPTWAVEINYSQPLGSWPVKYNALVVMHGPKGCGEPCEPLGPGLIRTTEYLTQQILVFDVGQVAWNLPQRYVIFGGYRWWKNKFGISANQPNGYFVGTTESTWLAGTA